MKDNTLEYARRTDENRGPVRGPAIVTIIATAVASGVTLLVLADQANTSSPSLAGIVFASWVISPYLVLALMAWGCRHSPGASVVMLITTVLTAGFGLFALHDAFYVHLDPQSALVLVFLPAWQFAPMVLAGPIAAVFASRPTAAQAT